MGERTKIEWATHSFNTHEGCTKVSPGCKFCYAEALSKRFGRDLWGPTAGRKPMSEAYWNQLAKWDRQAAKEGAKARVFCNSISDLFEGPETCQDPEAYAVVEAVRKRLFGMVTQTPNLIYLLLTKRPENIRRMAPKGWLAAWPENVWVGTSVEDQETADRRIPELLRVPAPIRFLSVEPLLGPVDLQRVRVKDRRDGVSSGFDALNGCLWWCSDQGEYANDHAVIHWVIIGGESGRGARPFYIEWAMSMLDQCREAGVPAFLKQLGRWPVSKARPPFLGFDAVFGPEMPDGYRWMLNDDHGGDWSEWPAALRVREFPEEAK